MKYRKGSCRDTLTPLTVGYRSHLAVDELIYALGKVQGPELRYGRAEKAQF